MAKKLILKSLLKVGEKYIVITDFGEVSEFIYLGFMSIELPDGTESVLLKGDKCYII